MTECFVLNKWKFKIRNTMVGVDLSGMRFRHVKWETSITHSGYIPCVCGCSVSPFLT